LSAIYNNCKEKPLDTQPAATSINAWDAKSFSECRCIEHSWRGVFRSTNVQIMLIWMYKAKEARTWTAKTAHLLLFSSQLVLWCIFHNYHKLQIIILCCC